jgi:hypothetical protein
VPYKTEPIQSEKSARGTRDTHPAFGVIQANRVSSSPPGQVLFDSDIRHQHFVKLTISEADRERDLNHDWVYEGKTLIEVWMSEAQWAQMVSSMNSSPTSVTLRRRETEHDLPGLPFDSRLELSHTETRNAAHRMMEGVKEAMAAYKENKSAQNLRLLEAAIRNSEANVEFAAESLTEHSETVVAKARTDIEAFVSAAAGRHPELEGTKIELPEISS